MSPYTSRVLRVTLLSHIDQVTWFHLAEIKQESWNILCTGVKCFLATQIAALFKLFSMLLLWFVFEKAFPRKRSNLASL